MKSKIILIIEDDEFLRGMYRDKLLKEGYRILEAGDAEQGMKLALGEKPNLIVLDLILPKGNGFELMERLQKETKTKKIPILVLTSLGQESDRQEMLEKGAADYLVKSETSVSQVVERIKKQLENLN